jgi:hypothetical protein
LASSQFFKGSLADHHGELRHGAGALAHRQYKSTTTTLTFKCTKLPGFSLIAEVGKFNIVMMVQPKHCWL